MARVTRVIVSCDRCGSEDDVREYVVTSRRGRRSLTTFFDACSACESFAKPIDWAVVGGPVGGTLPPVQAQGWPKTHTLGPAIENFSEMRRQVKVGKAELRREAVQLSVFLSANGNILLRHVGETHVERASGGGQPEPELLAALDCLFEWCREMRWMPGGHDPLAPYRADMSPTADPANGYIWAACTQCRRDRMVAGFSVAGTPGSVHRVALCLRCQRKPWSSIAPAVED